MRYNKHQDMRLDLLTAPMDTKLGAYFEMGGY